VHLDSRRGHSYLLASCLYGLQRISVKGIKVPVEYRCGKPRFYKNRLHGFLIGVIAGMNLTATPEHGCSASKPLHDKKGSICIQRTENAILETSTVPGAKSEPSHWQINYSGSDRAFFERIKNGCCNGDRGGRQSAARWSQTPPTPRKRPADLNPLGSRNRRGIASPPSVRNAAIIGSETTSCLHRL
jgi:hypothetical protein